MNKISDEEIVEFLKNMLSISVTRDQLSKPTRDFVVGIYGRFLEEFGCQNLNQPDIMACDSVLNIEYMDSIIYPINIFKAIQKYLVHFGINDFCLQDILQPKRNRTSKIISTLCKFFVQFIHIKQNWLQIEENCAGIPQKINELDQKNLELKHNIEEKSMLLASLKNKSLGLDKDLAIQNELSMKKKKEVDKQSQQFKQTKSEIMKVRDNLCKIDIEISEKKEKNKELEEMIVRSPQKSIKITNDLERALEKTKLEVQNKKQESLHIIKKLDCQKTVFTSLTASTEDISNLLIMLSETDNQCENLENIKQDAMNIQEEIKSIEIKDKEMQAAKQGWQSKRNNTARQYAREYATLRDLNNGLQQTIKDKDALGQQLQQKLQTTEQQEKDLQKEYDQLDQAFEHTLNQYLIVSNKFYRKFESIL